MSVFIIIFVFFVGGFIGFCIGAFTEFNWKAYFEYRLKREEINRENRIVLKEVERNDKTGNT